MEKAKIATIQNKIDLINNPIPQEFEHKNLKYLEVILKVNM